MAPRTKEQYDQIREERRKHILQAGMELFAQKGYHGTSVSMIANHVGISTGLMYNYFANKEDLLKGIILEGVKSHEEMLSNIEITDPPHDKLVKAIDYAFDNIIVKNNDFWRLYITVLLQPDMPESIHQYIRDFMHESDCRAMTLLGDMGVKNPLLEVLFISAFANGVIIDRWFYGDEYPVDDLKKLVLDRYRKFKPGDDKNED